MAEPLVLAIDTSTVIAVGLAEGEAVLGDASYPGRTSHAEQLMPTVARCLDQAGRPLADVGLIVVGLGPGPFTGLRVGIVTARTLAAIRGLPLHGVCSLDALAAQYVHGATPPTGDFVAATDARRRELYWARYAFDGTRLDGPHVGSTAGLPGVPVVGPGAELYPDQLDRRPDGPAQLDGGRLARYGPALASAGTEPLYLRRPDAAEPGRRKSVLPATGPR